MPHRSRLKPSAYELFTDIDSWEQQMGCSTVKVTAFTIVPPTRNILETIAFAHTGWFTITGWVEL